MLTYLWGDVLTLEAGIMKPGEFMGMKQTQGMLWGVAIVMVIPIVMVFLSWTLNYPVNRWANIIVAIIFIGFHLGTMRGFPSWYKFLLIVGIGFNVLTIWYAWKWVV
jgi:phosphate/sulfate permease